MTLRKRRRIAFVVALLVGGAGAAGLTVAALRDSVLYYYSPGDVVEKRIAPEKAFRIGGLVKKGSVVRVGGALRFAVTDGKTDVPVFFAGLAPALFAEGRGVVATGRLNGAGVFVADQVLARHDERYMPPQAADALKRSGRWKESERDSAKRENTLKTQR
jgi:cytochrome c-type biogenesis protein CcmE